MTVYVGDASYAITGLPNSGSSSNVQCDLAEFSIIAAGGSEKSIRFEAPNRIFLDNIEVTSATAPALEVQGNTTFTNVAVNQQCSGNLTVKGYNLTAGGTTSVALSGDSQFATEVTSLNNNDLMTEDGATVPFTFSAAAAGSYTRTAAIAASVSILAPSILRFPCS